MGDLDERGDVLRHGRVIATGSAPARGEEPQQATFVDERYISAGLDPQRGDASGVALVAVDNGPAAGPRPLLGLPPHVRVARLR